MTHVYIEKDKVCGEQSMSKFSLTVTKR